MLFSNERASLIDALALPDGHAQWLREAFAGLPDDAKVRALVLEGSPDRVRRQFGEVVAKRFDPYWSRISPQIPNAFAMIPAEYFIATVLELASYIIPHAHPTEKLYQTVRHLATDFVHESPLVQMLRRAAGDDPINYVVMQVRNAHNWANFGHLDVTIDRSSMYLIIHHEEMPSALLSPCLKALYECTGSLFDGDSEIWVDTLSPMRFDIHVKRAR